MKHCINKTELNRDTVWNTAAWLKTIMALTNQKERCCHVVRQRAYQSFPNSRQGKNRRKHICTMFCWSPLKYIIHILTFNGTQLGSIFFFFSPKPVISDYRDQSLTVSYQLSLWLRQVFKFTRLLYTHIHTHSLILSVSHTDRFFLTHSF